MDAVRRRPVIHLNAAFAVHQDFHAVERCHRVRAGPVWDNGAVRTRVDSYFASLDSGFTEGFFRWMGEFKYLFFDLPDYPVRNASWIAFSVDQFRC